MADVGAIPTGISVRIDTGVTAPVIGNIFRFQSDPAGTDFSIAIQSFGTVTTLSADLEMSLDGGTTWVKLYTAFMVTATPFKVITPSSASGGIVLGALFRINYTTASGSINTNICSN
jgi:hypothetical protein